MTKQRRRVSAVVRHNRGLPCVVTGCTEHRYALSPYCCRHASAADRNGHPTGAAVRVKLWAPYRDRIRALLAANEDHPGLALALRWLASWMAQAEALDGHRQQPWAAEVARLKRAGVSPLDLLVELAAVHTLLQERPALCRDDAHRAFTTSKALLQLAPRPRRVTREAARNGTSGYPIRAKPAALRHVGPHVLRALAPLLANLQQALESEEERARAEVEALRQPLSPSRQPVARAMQAAGISTTTTPTKDPQ